MSESNQARTERRAPETEVSVDLSQADPSKAVQRRAKPSDIASGVRDDRGTRRTPAEKELFKRMSRFQTNITRDFNQKLADQQAAHEREMSALREEYEGVRLERGESSEAQSAHDLAMKALIEKLAAANERGDSAAAATITAEMIKADGAFHARQSGTKQRQDTTGGDRRQQQQPAARPAPAAAATGPTGAGARWITAQEDWWDDPEYAAEKAAAGAIFLHLRDQEGYAGESAETFREVSKRMRAKFPNLDVRDPKRRGERDDPDDDPDDELEEPADREVHRRRAPAATFQDRGTTDNQRRSLNDGRRTLTPQEMATMKACNLNPDNDRDVVQFLREAVALDQAAS